MKICILGAGALGCAIGGVLSEAGSEVYLINQRTEIVDRINTHGLKLTEGASERAIEVRAATNCQGIGPVDLIIVLVKSFHTRDAIEKASNIIGDQTVVLSLQNGLGNEEILIDLVGKERVIGGKTYVGGVMTAPGHVTAGVKGKYSFIGELDGGISERVVQIADELNRAGLSTTVTTNIIGMIWDKLLINVATGALTGITKLVYGGLYRVPEIRECALAAIVEGIAVAKANGVTLSTERPEEIWLKAAEGLPHGFKTSMLQSLEKGSRTEIDFINGSVVRWGEKCNIPTPVNKALVAGIKGIEYWMEHYAGKA